MPHEPLWCETPSGELAYRAKLRMEDAVRRLRAETHPRQRWGILLEYTVLMGEWLHHMQEHLRELDAAPLARNVQPESIKTAATTP